MVKVSIKNYTTNQSEIMNENILAMFDVEYTGEVGITIRNLSLVADIEKGYEGYNIKNPLPQNCNSYLDWNTKMNLIKLLINKKYIFVDQKNKMSRKEGTK
jgi:hypothetical protein